eukprot:GFYU01003495.1.p1 GENE.GFYU01003495.1~~GFYU01003495.1.p1  ORF type:complete len:371 (-),score=101.83 GFYU01003495.1:271-1383(-)
MRNAGGRRLVDEPFYRNLIYVCVAVVVFGLYFWFSASPNVYVTQPAVPRTKYPKNDFTSEARHTAQGTEWDFALIADLDHDSRVAGSKKPKWSSIFLTGVLKRNKDGQWSMDKTEKTDYFSSYNDGKRGMELSELVKFNGMLLTFCDRTGIVYEIRTKSHTLASRYILAGGDGNVEKGFKSEWATVKDGKLYVGSLGKEWTDRDGTVQNTDPQYVKVIDELGHIEHVDWSLYYNKMRDATGTPHPGYLIHEAAFWDEGNKRWIFVPRRASSEAYDEVDDETRGTNLFITADEEFSSIDVVRIGEVKDPKRGYSSFKPIPGREGEFIGLKTEEEEAKGYKASYLTVFNERGDVLMEETFIDLVKFEGVDFL